MSSSEHPPSPTSGEPVAPLDAVLPTSQLKDPSQVQEKARSEEHPKGKSRTTPKKSRPSWFYSVLPYQIALGPISTFVQLYILHLYGSDVGKIYVGLATTAFNAVSIPAAMIWGFTTDRVHRRKLIIIASFFATGANIFAFLIADNFYSITFLYCLFSLLSSGAATPLNLLIMESEVKSKWASTFARFSMVSSLGVTLSLLLSLWWVSYLPFEWLVIPLSILSVVSGVLAFMMIKEPSFVFERQMMVMNKRSFFVRILHLPMIFLHIPRASDFRRVFEGLRYELTSYTPILYMSVFAFNFGSSLFNTSLVPAMYSNSISGNQVFLVIFVANLIQIFAFRYVGPYIERKTLIKSAVVGLVFRSMCYALFGISALLVSGFLFIIPSLIFYPLAAGIAYAIYYTASSTLVFNSLGQQKSQGSTLGVYSAMSGVATMTGSLVSGFTSFYYGFDVTFVLAGFSLAGGAILTSSLRNLAKNDAHPEKQSAVSSTLPK